MNQSKAYEVPGLYRIGQAVQRALTWLGFKPKPEPKAQPWSLGVNRQSLVEVRILVPLSEVNFDACKVTTEFETSEFHGATETYPVTDVDLSGAEYMGIPVTFSEDDYDTASQYLIMERK